MQIIQGPLAGISSAPFRALCQEYGEPDFCCTEMISAKHLVNHFSDQTRFVCRSPSEGKLCYQISGNDADILSRATNILNNLGADSIDLNCGCPKPKIRKKGTGTKLLEDATHLKSLIKAIKHEANCPVSIKIRIDGNSEDCFTQSVIDAAHDADADFLIIHARHWTEDYETPIHLDQLAKWVEYSSIPVIGNGDVSCLKSLQKILTTKCNGVMISRAGVGRPWMTKSLKAALRGDQFTPPSNAMVGQIFLQHIRGLAELDGEKLACLSARRLGKYYNQNRVSQQFNIDIKNVEFLAEIEDLIHSYFE